MNYDPITTALENANDNLKIGNFKAAILSMDVVEQLTNDAPIEILERLSNLLMQRS